MEDKNSKTIWAIVGLIVVILIVVLVSRSYLVKTGTLEKSGEQTNVTPETTVEPESTLDATVTESEKPVAVTIAYTDALVQYKDRRIQFDKGCQAFPNTITYNDNFGIMLDNRSPNTRKIKVGTVYSIKPYGFKIVKLPDVYLTSKATLLVDCDERQNVATILVQD